MKWLLDPRIAVVGLLFSGIALVSEAVRELFGSSYAVLTWGVALIIIALAIARGVRE